MLLAHGDRIEVENRDDSIIAEISIDGIVGAFGVRRQDRAPVRRGERRWGAMPEPDHSNFDWA
jgi:hypothetical protein